MHGTYKKNSQLDFANRMEDVKQDYENLLARKRKRMAQLEECEEEIILYEATFPELKRTDEIKIGGTDNSDVPSV